MALSTLRLLCSDLKTDKRWRQYAGAQVKSISPFRPCMLSMQTHDSDDLHDLSCFCYAPHMTPVLVHK